MKPQTKRKIFFTLAILFFISAGTTIAYSLGWRFDWKNKKITQPGMFYFKTKPANAQIYINNKPKKKTDFFFGSALIDNLLPGKYKIKIEKNGFSSWEKTLTIKKREVTEAKSIVLIPKNYSFSQITNQAENFFISPNQKEIIIEEKIVNHDSSNAQATTHWSLKLFEIDKELKSSLIEEQDILNKLNSSKISKNKIKKVSLQGLKFSPDSKRILLKITTDEKEEKRYFFLLSIDQTPVILKNIKLSLSNLENVYFNPGNQKEFFILVNLEENKSKDKTTEKYKDQKKEKSPYDLSSLKILQKINLEKNEKKVLLKDIITLTLFKNNIYYLNKSGFLFKADLSLKNKEKLNLYPLDVQKKWQILKATDNYIFLKEERNLYLLEKGTLVKKIVDNFNNLTISPDEKKIAFYNNHEIYLLFLKKKYNQPTKEKGEISFLGRFKGEINNLFWWTNNYLIFNNGEEIKISEIDDRDKINIVQIGKFPKPKIFWNQKYNSLLVLSNNKLYFSQGLKP